MKAEHIKKMPCCVIQSGARTSINKDKQFRFPVIQTEITPQPPRCFTEESCVSVPDAEGYVMVLQPEEPKISLSGIDHFARSAAEFESREGVTLFPELRIVSTITREVETDTETEVAEGADDDPTGKRRAGRR